MHSISILMPCIPPAIILILHTYTHTHKLIVAVSSAQSIVYNDRCGHNNVYKVKS